MEKDLTYAEMEEMSLKAKKPRGYAEACAVDKYPIIARYSSSYADYRYHVAPDGTIYETETRCGD